MSVRTTRRTRRGLGIAGLVLAAAALVTGVTAKAPTPARAGTGSGYWLVGTDGGVFAFGQAGFHGSAGGMGLNQPIIGTATTPRGGGYWMVAADGGIFAFGDAAFVGSTGAIRLNSPVVGIAAFPR